MTSSELQIIDHKDLNLEVLYKIIKDANYEVSVDNDRLVIAKSGFTSSLFYKGDVINIYTSFSIKKDIDIEVIYPMLLKLNGNHSFTKTTISEEKRKLVTSMNYLTTTGLFVPHFILSLGGYFAFQRIGFEKVDFSEILE